MYRQCGCSIAARREGSAVGSAAVDYTVAAGDWRGGETGEVGRDQNTEHDEWMILFASFPPSVPFASNGRDRNSNTKTGGLLPSPRSRGGANRFIQNGAT